MQAFERAANQRIKHKAIMSLETTWDQHILADETCVSNSRMKTQRCITDHACADGELWQLVHRRAAPEHMDAEIERRGAVRRTKHGTVDHQTAYRKRLCAGGL